jgi:O-methyltransferase
MNKKFAKALQDERDRIIDILRQTSFVQFDDAVPHKQVIPYASYAPWEADEVFKLLYNSIKDNTLVDIYRCYELWNMVKDLNDVEADILEVGVWRGGTGALLCKGAAANSNTKVYLADTFAGVVKATTDDTVYRGGEHADTSEETVRELLKQVDVNNFQILKGVFPDDFTETHALEKIKLCHIDVDTYQSAKEVFEYAWPRMVTGGIVIFDDYGFWTCEGVTKYFNALDPGKGRKIHNLNGHGIIIKFAD